MNEDKDIVPTQREKFQPFVDQRIRPRLPELATQLMTAVDAFDAIQSTGKLLPEQLQTIIDTVSSSHRPLYENTCDFMRKLSEKWPEANAAILAMSQDKKAHIRFNAILCVGKSTPTAVLEQVLKSGLLDKSARVRGKASDWMGRLHYKNLVPELTAALAVEMHAGTRKTMEFYLRLLRDGYILKKDADGRYSVTVPMPNGGISGRFIDEKLLREKGIDAIVAEYVESATKSPLWR